MQPLGKMLLKELDNRGLLWSCHCLIDVVGISWGMCTDAGAVWGFISAVSLFFSVLGRGMYPSTFVFHLHVFLISCKYLLTFFFVVLLANLQLCL